MRCSAKNCENQDDIFEGDCVKCYGCKKYFHYNCCGVAESTHRRKSEKIKKEWRCLFCRPSKTRNLTNDISELGSIETDNVINTIRNPDLQILYSSIHKKIDELIQSNQFLSTKYDEVIERLNEKDDQIKLLKRQVDKQSHEIKMLENKQNEIEQYSRKDNIEIKGIEKKNDETDEELQTKILKLFNAWKVKVVESDISISHRLFSKNNTTPPPILVKLKDRRLRDKLLKAWKNISDKSQGAVFGNCSRKEQKITITENLSQHYKQLLYKAKLKAGENNYEAVWFFNGKLMIKKNATSKPIRIYSEEDLNKL